LIRGSKESLMQFIEGQQINVKLTEIDEKKHRYKLSIKEVTLSNDEKSQNIRQNKAIMIDLDEGEQSTSNFKKRAIKLNLGHSERNNRDLGRDFENTRKNDSSQLMNDEIQRDIQSVDSSEFASEEKNDAQNEHVLSTEMQFAAHGGEIKDYSAENSRDKQLKQWKFKKNEKKNFLISDEHENFDKKIFKSNKNSDNHLKEEGYDIVIEDNNVRVGGDENNNKVSFYHGRSESVVKSESATTATVVKNTHLNHNSLPSSHYAPREQKNSGGSSNSGFGGLDSNVKKKRFF
jgi:hypothetical protein